MNDDDDLWAQYARLSPKADTDRLGDHAWAADEALDEILNRIEMGRSISASETANLIANRARKYRARRHLLDRNVALFPSAAANESDRQDALDAIRRSASVWTAFESRLLFAVASGETYGSLATKEAVPLSTIKTWVRRARSKGAR